MTYSSTQPFDASFAGGSVTVDGRRITAFIDDKNPVRVEEVAVGEMVPSVNGAFGYAIKPSFFKVIITVIPDSDDNVHMRSIVSRTIAYDASQGYGGTETVEISLTTGKGFKFKLPYCVCIGAEPCFSVSPQGKIGGVMYVFGCPASWARMI